MIEWLKAHARDIFDVLAVVYIILLSVKNRYGDKAPKWVDVALDVLALLPKRGAVGVLGPVNVPLVPSFGGKQDKPQDPPVSGAALVLVVASLGIAVATSGCALSPAGRAHVALSTAAQIGEAADKAISAADQAFQDSAVREAEEAGSTTAARLKLAAWRDKRAKARAAEQEYYAALVGWQIALTVAENAKDRRFDFAALIDGVTKMGRALLDGLRGLGINVPGVPNGSR